MLSYMSRKQKARAISGWLIIGKPKGLTSTAVVNKVKWALNARKAGHAGTLDPNATGVLAIALGEATKTVPYVTNALKCYQFVVRFGMSTNTDDEEGQVIRKSYLRPNDEQILKALKKFTGHIEQYPPIFSAVKIGGERAYALARKKEVFNLSPRPLYVENLFMVERLDRDHVKLEMVCGKGGYVRSIARDLGETLNCYGQEDLSHITDDLKMELVKLPYGMVQKMIEYVHFSKKRPENWNIKLTNKKDKMIKVFRGNKF